MNILIYVPNMTQEWGGVRQYTAGLLNILSENCQNKYFIYHNSNDGEIVKFKGTVENFTFVTDDDVAVSRYDELKDRAKRITNKFINRIRPQLAFKFLPVIDKICLKFKIDLIHCPYQSIPNTTRVKLVTTMHDVQELYFPEYFTPEERAKRATKYLDSIKRSDKIVVSYEHVKNDLIKFFQVSDSKVNVILLDMHKLWFEKFEEKNILSIEKLRVPGRFILYPANTWKHKNHLTLIEAIKNIKDVHNEIISLVCTGHQNEHYLAIQERVRELELGDQIKFLGTVTEHELFSLYKNCLGVVIPTTYEAGSFPLMESMLLRIPVICSNVTSLPETIGSEEFLFDPFSIEQMGNKILKLWQCSDFRKRNVENSIGRSASLRDNKALRKFQNLYLSLDSSGGAIN